MTDPTITEEDYEIDSDGLLVFTEKYLKKRGFCCEQGCRHCPYGFKQKMLSYAENQIGTSLKKTEAFEKIIIFTDGACSGNPGRGGWGAIIATPDGQVTELGAAAPETTNNRMEIIAAASALNAIADDDRPVNIYTDSVYVIRGITEWIWGWRKRGWKKSTGENVANQDLWEWLAELTSARKGKAAAEWHYVRGHIGTPGNERVDEIAVSFTQGKKINLYQGTLQRYDVAIHDIPEDTSVPEMKEAKPKAKAHSYLSVVDGIVRRHLSWPECERFTKGRSGAKFKKAMSASEEETVLAGWGYSVKDIQE